MWETWVRSLGQEDPLEKEMATHSSILAWRIPWTKEPGGLQSTGSQRVGHDWATSFSVFPHFQYWLNMSITFSRIKDNETEAPPSGILAWKIPWTESPHGKASRTDWSNAARAHAQSFGRVGLSAASWTQAARLLCPRALQSGIRGWVAMPSSKGSSWPRGGTHISYISSLQVDLSLNHPGSQRDSIRACKLRYCF